MTWLHDRLKTSTECAGIAPEHRAAWLAHCQRNNLDHRTGKPWEHGYNRLFDLMSEIVIARDGFKCTTCNAPNVIEQRASGNIRSLRVHHIDEVKTNNHPHNLISLCHGCHMTHHKSAHSPFPQLPFIAIERTAAMPQHLKDLANDLLREYA